MAASNTSNISIGTISGIKKDLLSAGNNSPTPLFTIPIPNSSGVGGNIIFTVFVTDGTYAQSLSSSATWAGVADTGGTVTSAAIDAASPNSVDSGGGYSLTATTTTTSATNLLTVNMTPNTSNPNTLTIYNLTYTIANNSPQAINVL